MIIYLNLKLTKKVDIALQHMVREGAHTIKAAIILTLPNFSIKKMSAL